MSCGRKTEYLEGTHTVTGRTCTHRKATDWIWTQDLFAVRLITAPLTTLEVQTFSFNSRYILCLSVMTDLWPLRCSAFQEHPISLPLGCLELPLQFALAHYPFARSHQFFCICLGREYSSIHVVVHPAASVSSHMSYNDESPSFTAKPYMPIP